MANKESDGQWSANATFNDLPVETLTQIAQLLSESSLQCFRPACGRENALLYVPSFPGSFFRPIVSLSRVSKRLRAICKPYLRPYIWCKNIKSLEKVTRWYKGAPLYSVRTLSAALPYYSIYVTDPNAVFDSLRILDNILYERDIGKCLSLIPNLYPSLHCLRLHNVPNLDEFFASCAVLVSLRILDIQLCDSVVEMYTAKVGGATDRTEQIAETCNHITKNTPPLENLRIAFAFDSSPEPFFSSNRSKIINQINTLIRTTGPTLVDFALVGFSNISFDELGLEICPFPCLRRLTIWSVDGPIAGIAKFILVLQLQLEEVNLDYSHAPFRMTLSFLSRIMGGVCPSEGFTGLIGEGDVNIESLVHPEDSNWGSYGCRKFAYAKRGEDVVEISLCFGADNFLTVTSLVPFLKRLTHLEVLKLVVSYHGERYVATFMNELGNLCEQYLQKLRTLNVHFDLEPLRWGTENSKEEDVDLLGDGPRYNEFYWEDDDGVGLDETVEDDPYEICVTRWKIIDDRWHSTMESIMARFFEKASSVREVFFHSKRPVEGDRTTCWSWRRAKQKGAEASEGKATSLQCGQSIKSKGFVVGDLMIEGTCLEPPIFTYTVGGEASYRRAFSHEDDTIVTYE
ncbi:hypothetical protein SCHPADRAFT_386143 [Schizopora paradoxa]|uniref:Uncharacterized protein n=1 Tax=Schizopora paradoxa TaxID=27342 RepID=A0A0H2RUC7_9AGAM|nr:hypothetical protein SCHPADRAFT_386143 [Schizopora paradoxa]